MKEQRYSWNLVAEVANKKFLEQNQDAPKEKQFDKKFDPLTEIYRNILPTLIKDVMVGAYIRNDYSPEMNVLILAYEELQKVGKIGTAEYVDKFKELN